MQSENSPEFSSLQQLLTWNRLSYGFPAADSLCSSSAYAVEFGERSEGRSVSASKNHKEAERRPRERINCHLDRLRAIHPCNSKIDKASLVAIMVERVRELKRQTSEMVAATAPPSMSSSTSAAHTSGSAATTTPPPPTPPSLATHPSATSLGESAATVPPAPPPIAPLSSTSPLMASTRTRSRPRITSRCRKSSSRASPTTSLQASADQASLSINRWRAKQRRLQY